MNYASIAMGLGSNAYSAVNSITDTTLSGLDRAGAAFVSAKYGTEGFKKIVMPVFIY